MIFTNLYYKIKNKLRDTKIYISKNRPFKKYRVMDTRQLILEETFEEFKENTLLFKNICIPSNKEFNNLYGYLRKNMNPEIWLLTINGRNNEFETYPYIFDSTQSIKLHSLASFSKCRNKLLKIIYPCIYNFNDFYYFIDDMPTGMRFKYMWKNKEELISIWNKRFRIYGVECDLCECHICLNSIKSRNIFCICNNCRTITHLECKEHFFSSQINTNSHIKCELCRCDYEFDNIDITMCKNGILYEGNTIIAKGSDNVFNLHW